MKTHVFSPENAAVKSLVEYYSMVETWEPVEVRTLPNGRVDASIVLDGEIEWYFESTRAFEKLPPATFYPPTRNGGRARSRAHMCCIGIRFYPHILALPVFEDKKLVQPVSFDVFTGTSSVNVSLIESLRNASGDKALTQLLDTYLSEQFLAISHAQPWIQKVTEAIESQSRTQKTIGDIAEDLNISIKTLERKFSKVIGLSPKAFAAIIQLHQTTSNIQNKTTGIEHGDLTKSLVDGYYDQSHFIKACKKITGFTPKVLFTQLAGKVTDIVVVG